MSQEERLMILQMVADKKVTAAEAAELLRALEGDEQVQSGAGKTEVPPAPPFPPAPPAPPLQSAPPPGPRFSGLGSFIEGVIDRVTSALGEVIEPKYEFPTEYTGEFGSGEIPLRILTGNGRVEIRSWDQPGYKAVILARESGESEEEARKRVVDAFTLRAGEDEFELEARRAESGERAVHVTLMVPQDRSYRLEVRTGNGRIHLEDLCLTEARVTTGNGRILIRGGQADRTVLRSGNGSVEVESEIVDLEAGSGNGALTVRPSGERVRNLKLSTGNGSIRVETSRIAPGAGFQVEAHTGMGGARLALPDMVYERDVRSMAHKHIIARSACFEEAAFPVAISVRTGMGSIAIE